VQTIAHRGASGYAPENTRAAFDRAIAMGASAIETDVRLTYDGAMVLIHDPTVDRTSNGTGPVDDHTLAELRHLDLGGWFAPTFTGQRILTPAEMIDEYIDRIPVVFEIKDPRVTTQLLHLLAGAAVLDRVQVTSFLWYPLLEARENSQHLTLGGASTNASRSNASTKPAPTARQSIGPTGCWTSPQIPNGCSKQTEPPLPRTGPGTLWVAGRG
jgi:glycerophosphoryl diester phosphodiesterase